MEIVRTLIVGYLAFTLSATGLAKMVNRASASAGMIREGVLSDRASMPVITATSSAEIALALGLAFGIYPEVFAFGTAILFALFAGYRLTVAFKLRAIVCSCAGYVRTDPASRSAVAGAVLACAFAAALAVTSAFLGSPAGYPINLISVACVVIPFIIATLGVQRRKRRGQDGLLTSEYMSLGTESLFSGNLDAPRARLHMPSPVPVTPDGRKTSATQA